MFLSHGDSKSRGIAFLLPQNKSYKILSYKNILEGRIASLAICFDESTITLINVYFPTKDKQSEQLTVIRKLETYLSNSASDTCIIGGDLNLYINPLLDKHEGKNTDHSQAGKALKNLLSDQDLVDVWRAKNPNSKRYTWRSNNPLVQTRLDYWLISATLMYNVTDCEIKPSIKSDHCLISLAISRNLNTKKGPGLWKFNSSLLQNDDYVQMMTVKFTYWDKEYSNMQNKNLKWDIIKSLIRIETKKFSKKLARQNKDAESELYERLQHIMVKLDVHQTESLLTEYQTIQNQLEILNSAKAQGAKIRAKVDWVADSERCTAYFLNLEKQHGKMASISRLVENGKEVKTHNEILEMLKCFYSDLYSKNNSLDPNNYKAFLNNNVPKLSQSSAALCEEPISYKKIQMAIKNLKSNKSPGTDGLTTEFYIFFYEKIKSYLFDCINYSFENKILSIEQRRGVLKIIPKKDKDLTNMRSFRPISLLNTDYKIITHILATRLQNVLPEIISSDQNGYLKGRFIGHNIRTIIDTIQHTTLKNRYAYLLFLDFEKALDKVDHRFLINAMHTFGFGENFIQWIKILYTDIQSCVINNGFTSQYFRVMAGIRQGCPISALLFIIAAECLSIFIKNNCNIKGIKMGGLERKITQLADDTTMFLKDIESIQATLNGLHLFYTVSGLKLNNSKTVVLPIGKNCPKPQNNLFDLQWGCTEVFSLGTWFCGDLQNIIKKNHDLKLEKFRRILNHWSKFNLTLMGKVTILKSIALANLNYLVSSLYTPDWFIKCVHQCSLQFLWDNKPNKIKANTLYNNIDKGGINFPHFESYVMAQKCNWIKRWMGDCVTKSYLESLLPVSVETFVHCNPKLSKGMFKLPKFYYQVFSCWFKLKEEPSAHVEVLQEYICLNKLIEIDNKMVLDEGLLKPRLLRIQDIVNNRGDILTHEEFCGKFNTTINWLKWHSIKHAIPHKWKQLLKLNIPFENVKPCEKQITLVSSKACYQLLLKGIITKPTCIDRWNDKGYIFSEDIWKKIFLLPKFTTFNARSIMFQYKILHRIYASESILSKFLSNVNSKCEFCDTDKNIIHTFFECIKIKTFWLNVESWFYQTTKIKINFDVKDILFGIYKNIAFNTLINFCVLTGKIYIHTCNREKRIVSLTNYIVTLKHQLRIEQQVYDKKGKCKKFNTLFGPLLGSI